MRLKSADGQLQAVYNRNNDILNSPKRINTAQNSNYTQNTQYLTDYNNVTTNDISNLTGNIEQLNIEDVAALNNVHNDTQELQWCISDLNTTTNIQDQQQQLNIQRQRALNSISNNKLNINFTLAARLRLRAQNAPSFDEDLPMPQSPDDVLIDEDDVHHSCNSSTSTSPQDEDRVFDTSDSADSSDEGNDYYRPTSTDIRQTPLKGFVNPNYPGFQHLAHTLEFDEDTLNSANNNNGEYEVADQFDSVNRLDSDIQKVFHDKSLDLDVDQRFVPIPAQIQDSPNDTNSANCDSGSDCSGTSDFNISNTETVDKKFNILINEQEVFSVELGNSETSRDIQCVGAVDEGEDIACSNENTHLQNSVVGDFRKEIEAELGKVSSSFEQHLPKATQQELEEAVEKLQVITDLQPSAARYSIQPNNDQPFSKEASPIMQELPIVLQDSSIVKSPSNDILKENVACLTLQQKKQETLAKLSKSLNLRSQLRKSKTYETGDLQQSMEIDQIVQLKEQQTRKQVPSFLPLEQNIIDHSQQILSPIENKMTDALLSNCQEDIPRIEIGKPTSTNGIKTLKTSSDVNKMEVDSGSKKIDLGRRDSNRELEEIELQIKKIKSDTICNMEKRDLFRKEELSSEFTEKDEDCSVTRQKPQKVINYVKKRRDYNQQFGSLITFPKRETVKRDPLNRRSIPMIKDRKKIAISESLGGFDVYNIETAMPKIDLEAIECHLKAAGEEERRVSDTTDYYSNFIHVTGILHCNIFFLCYIVFAT